MTAYLKAAPVQCRARRGDLAAVKRASSYTVMHGPSVASVSVMLVVAEKCDRTGRIMEWRSLDTGMRDSLTVRDTVLVVAGIAPDMVRESYAGSFDSFDDAKAFLRPFLPQAQVSK